MSKKNKTISKIDKSLVITKMMSFTDCPRCANQGLMIPLRKEDERYVCSMCKSVFQEE